MRPVSGVRRAFLHGEQSVIHNHRGARRELPATQGPAGGFVHAYATLAKFSFHGSPAVSWKERLAVMEACRAAPLLASAVTFESHALGPSACAKGGRRLVSRGGVYVASRLMRSLQRILLERKTRRFLDEMIHKYADIRLSATTRELSRKRRRSEASGVLKSTNGCGDMAQRYGDQDERSTSSSCRTESERSSRLSSSVLLDIERQSGKGRPQQQEQQDESQFDRWLMSEARTVSEYGSAFSSTRLARLLEEEDVDDNEQSSQLASRRGSDSSSVESTQQETEENQEHCCSSSECEGSSIHVESAPSSSTLPSDENQAEDQSEVSESQADTPPTSSTETLPRLRPTPPETRVVPNCCDFFPSPHPHYAKEVIGKCEGASPNTPSPTNDSSPDTSNQGADNESSSASTSENSRARNESSDDFEMWDYICPQYARRNYANEWF
ncbi:snRNA-activating protein complex subunit 3 [Phytophthora cinnamomi]|uniref:snRNA-activating protein complex subunit 3 n=1 Tax=Phytophthora cinnamomi TaxID=4785 RepID=UPI003559F368|nr:snRNA-activating protein complex subunit 3 [Phytophthora cinnamomi]